MTVIRLLVICSVWKLLRRIVAIATIAAIAILMLGSGHRAAGGRQHQTLPGARATSTLEQQLRNSLQKALGR
jgi:hypothetical protein